MKRGRRQDATAIQIRLNIIFLIISILCLLSIKVRSEGLNSKWRTYVEQSFRLDGGKIEVMTLHGRKIDIKDIQPGMKYFIRAGTPRTPVDIRSPYSTEGHLNSGGFAVPGQSGQYYYSLKNVNIRKPTAQEYADSGLTERDGYYLLEAVPDLSKIKEPVQIKMRFRQNLDQVFTMEVDVAGQFNSWLKLRPSNPTRPIHTISLAQNISANQEFVGLQPYLIDYDTFTFGTSSINLTELCRGRRMTSDDPCTVPNVVDQNSQIKATLRFEKEGKNLRVFVVRANYEGEVIEENGRKFPLITADFLRRHRVQNGKIELRIPVSLSNKAGDSDVSGMILNMVDFAQPPGGPIVCKDPIATRDGLYWLSLMDVKAALSGTGAVETSNRNGDMASRVQLNYNMSLEIGFLERNQVEIRRPNGQVFIGVRVDSLENFNMTHVNAIAEEIFSKYQGSGIGLGARFFTVRSTSSGRNEIMGWRILEQNGVIVAERIE